MTKSDFLRRMKEEKPLEGSPFLIEVGELVDSPYIIGIYKEDGVWKIYETRERGGYYIIKEIADEELAFDKLYTHVYIQKELNEYC